MDVAVIAKIVKVLIKDKHPKYAIQLLDECCIEDLSWCGSWSEEVQEDTCNQWCKLYDSMGYSYPNALDNYLSEGSI